MVNFCMFAGSEGDLSAGKRLYVTVFGGCELRRPTLARQIIEWRRSGGTGAAFKPRTAYFLTLFGGVSITAPTLAEEFLDLQDAIRANLITLEDWDRAIGQLSSGDLVRTASITIFGAFEGASVPDENVELDKLAAMQHLSRIPPEAVQSLMLGVGQRGAQRHAVIREAAGTSLA